MCIRDRPGADEVVVDKKITNWVDDSKEWLDAGYVDAKIKEMCIRDRVWSDEFNGDSLNRADWNVEIHEKGWVNNELQEYVDSAENIQVKDGRCV